MRIPGIGRRRRQNRNCLEILRGFTAAFEEVASTLDAVGTEGEARLLDYGRKLVKNKRDIARFLANNMDLLAPSERYSVYGHVAMLKEYAPAVFEARLRKERDQRCLERLERLAAVPRDDVSRARVARQARALFHAREVLRCHDAGKPDSDKVDRQRQLSRIADARMPGELDGTDLLVLLSITVQPNDDKLFFEAIKSLSDDQIMARKVTRREIAEALVLFGHEERGRFLLARILDAS